MSALRKVLVVDDDPVVGTSFNRVLSDKGYVVVTAANGREALNKLNEQEYDLVYTDIRMPGMDGIEVAERVKARRPWIPVVIVTGYGTDANEARAEAAGVSAFLRKPLSPEMIEGSAAKALRDAAKTVAQTLEAAVAAPVAQAKEPLPAALPAAEKAPVSALKAVGLMIAAPFIGLAYAIAFPFIGLAVLTYMAARAVWRRSGAIGRLARDIGLFLAAPFVGLAYIIAFPFVGMGVLAWMGYRAIMKKQD